MSLYFAYCSTRIGKSPIVEKFAREQYKSDILIDYANTSNNIRDNFNDNVNRLDLFFQVLSLEDNKQLYKRDTLIIFDEIQKFPKAREAIKYLVKDGGYNHIEIGSLISIKKSTI